MTMNPNPSFGTPSQELPGEGDPQLSEGAKGVDRAMLDRAVGGWRGLFDTGLPVMVFVAVYPLTGQQLRPATLAALACGGLIALWRIARRQPLSQIISGFVALVASAYLASRSGRGEDFFLLGILSNLGYGVAFLLSILVGWPLLGIFVGALQGDLTGWRRDPVARTIYRTASWLWVALFFGRLCVTVPLYLAGAVEALGIAKLILSWPPFLLVVFLSYRLIHPLHEAQQAAVAGVAGDDAEALPSG